MEAQRDQNRITTLITASSADGTTPIAIEANPLTHVIKAEQSAVPFATKSVAPRDRNRVPVLLAVSATDGVTPVVVYGNPVTKAFFIKLV